MRNWMLWHIFKRTRQGWSYCIYLCVCKDLWISWVVLILAEHPCIYRGRLAIDSSRIFSAQMPGVIGLYFICLSSSSRRAGIFSCWWQNARISKSHVRRLFPIFFSRSFMVSGLKFKSLIHFKLIFVSRVRKESSFISLHVDIHFPNTIYWGDYPFPFVYSWSPVKNQLTIYAQVYF